MAVVLQNSNPLMNAMLMLSGMAQGYQAHQQQQTQNQQTQQQLSNETQSLQNQGAYQHSQEAYNNLRGQALQQQLDQNTKLTQFEQGLKLPANWSKMTPDEQTAYLGKRMSAAQAAGDTDVAQRTGAWMQQIGQEQIRKQQVLTQAQTLSERVRHDQSLESNDRAKVSLEAERVSAALQRNAISAGDAMARLQLTAQRYQQLQKEHTEDLQQRERSSALSRGVTSADALRRSIEGLGLTTPTDDPHFQEALSRFMKMTPQQRDQALQNPNIPQSTRGYLNAISPMLSVPSP